MAFTPSSADVLKRLRLNFPINVQIPDPLKAGQQVELSKENLFSMLVIDGRAVDLELQAIPAQFMLAARAHRAAEKAAAACEAQFRAWKSTKMNEYAALKQGKSTVSEREDYYRASPDYATWNEQIQHWAFLVGLMDDLKAAFSMKSFSLRSMSRTADNAASTYTTEAREKLSNERLEEMAIDAIAESARDWYNTHTTLAQPGPAAAPTVARPMPAMPSAPPAVPPQINGTFDPSPTTIDDDDLEDEDDDSEEEETDDEAVDDADDADAATANCKTCGDLYYVEPEGDNGFCQDECEKNYVAPKAAKKPAAKKTTSKASKGKK